MGTSFYTSVPIVAPKRQRSAELVLYQLALA